MGRILSSVNRKEAFDNALVQQELLQDAKNDDQRSKMAPFKSLVEEGEKADTLKEDTHLSQIKLLHEQFAEATCQKGYDLSTSTSHNNDSTDTNKLGGNEIYGRKYNDEDEDFSYHSSDGSAKEDALTLGSWAKMRLAHHIWLMQVVKY
jgi:hypothetical protein